ncbi:hypothetical protein F5Y17DRAFT_83542 [Xylariaceae sp. FL0594]|nr:hypothetical protein F5Y17DRAFT_83542 [Xylariaceae sp. FL0594]
MSEPSSPLPISTCGNVTIEIPPASVADDEALVRALVDIINVEYRWGEAGVVVDGTQRTTITEVADQLRARQLSVAFLTSTGGHREAIGCIHVKKLSATHGNLGLLAVRAGHQGTGLARDLVRFGEDRCRRVFKAKTMQIELLVPTTFASAHKARLQTWYERMGYVMASMGDFGADYPHMIPVLLGPVEYRVFEKDLVSQARARGGTGAKL